MTDEQNNSKFKAFDIQRDLTFRLQVLATGAFSILAGFLAITERTFGSIWLVTVGFGLLGISFVAGLLGAGGMVWELQYTTQSPNLERYRKLFLVQWISLIVGGVLFVVFVMTNLPTTRATVPVSTHVPELSGITEFESPYANAAFAYWSDWNNGALHFAAKADFQPGYFDLLSARVELRPGGYEDAAWAQGMQTEWLSMPEDLTPFTPMTPGAQLALVSLLSDNEELLIEQGVTPNELAFTLERPTFQVLGLAQILAQSEGAQFILPNHIIAAADKWWTTIYPLCPPPDGGTASGLVP